LIANLISSKSLSKQRILWKSVLIFPIFNFYFSRVWALSRVWAGTLPYNF
jgi:hypothetical protein